MGKFFVEDKMRIQILRAQRMGAKAIKSAYPEKNWSLSTLKAMCRQIDATGSAVDRQAPAHTAAMTQEWIDQHCPDMIKKDEWPPKSPDLNPLITMFGVQC